MECLQSIGQGVVGAWQRKCESECSIGTQKLYLRNLCASLFKAALGGGLAIGVGRPALLPRFAVALFAIPGALFLCPCWAEQEDEPTECQERAASLGFVELIATSTMVWGGFGLISGFRAGQSLVSSGFSCADLGRVGIGGVSLVTTFYSAMCSALTIGVAGFCESD